MREREIQPATFTSLGDPATREECPPPAQLDQDVYRACGGCIPRRRQAARGGTLSSEYSPEAEVRVLTGEVSTTVLTHPARSTRRRRPPFGRRALRDVRRLDGLKLQGTATSRAQAAMQIVGWHDL